MRAAEARQYVADYPNEFMKVILSNIREAAINSRVQLSVYFDNTQSLMPVMSELRDLGYHTDWLPINGQDDAGGIQLTIDWSGDEFNN